MRTTAIENLTEFETALKAYPDKYRLICLVAVETGFRISDIINLKKRDITKDRVSITEKKTQKRRPLVLSYGLREELIKFSRRQFLRAEDFIFPSTENNRSKHISRQRIHQVFKKAAADAGMSGVISPHSCRKNYARNKFAEHGSVEKLQKDFKHRDKRTTEGYLE